MTSDKELDLRVRALESLLIEKGLVEEPAIEEIIDLFENRMGPHNGAKVVVRAWNDAAFKSRLLDNASEAIVEMGYEAVQGEDMVVVENTPQGKQINAAKGLGLAMASQARLNQRLNSIGA